MASDEQPPQEAVAGSLVPPPPAALTGQVLPPQDAPPGGSNGLAVASLVLGVLTMVTAGLASVCCACAGFLPLLALGPTAVILGHVSLRQIADSGGTQEGRGLAIAGLVTGYMGMALCVLHIVFIALMLGLPAMTKALQQGWPLR